LWPKGSGSSDNPITVAAFGDGSLPVIDGKGSESAVRLFNQHHWVIRNIEATGSSEYGIHISGDRGTLAHIRLLDLVVHNVRSTEKMKTKISGLVVVATGGNQLFEDVVIDGVRAYDTNRWAGIVVSGGAFKRGSVAPRSPNVIIRNSIVHDVYGDGIILFTVRDGIIERSAAWHTGLEPSYSIGTPNGIWTWTCDNCIVRETEGFFADSPGVDGGVYDIDWGNDRNLVADNFGHDAQAYCFAIFGAAGLVTTQSEVRGNVCAGNGRSPRLARRHGAVHLMTWEEGALDGVRIHDNLILWEPPIEAPLLRVNAEFSGSRPNVFENNRLVSSKGEELTSSRGIAAEKNEFLKRSDVLRLPTASPAPSELTAAGLNLGELRGSPVLVSFLGLTSGASRSQAVVVESAAVQYRSKGLVPLIVADKAESVRTDWHIRSARVRKGTLAKAELPLTFLLDREGRVLYRWSGYAPAKDVVFAVRKLLGPPAGANQD
jgi:hypothetical protein